MAECNSKESSTWALHRVVPVWDIISICVDSILGCWDHLITTWATLKSDRWDVFWAVETQCESFLFLQKMMCRYFWATSGGRECDFQLDRNVSRFTHKAPEVLVMPSWLSRTEWKTQMYPRCWKQQEYGEMCGFLSAFQSSLFSNISVEFGQGTACLVDFGSWVLSDR